MADRSRRGVEVWAAARRWWPAGGRPAGSAGSAGSGRSGGSGGSREFPTGWARRPAARATRAVFLSGVMHPLLRVTLRLRTYGAAEAFAPVGGTSVVIVSNHSSHLDAPLLLCSLPRRVRGRTAVTAAADYFFDSVWRGLSSALAFSTVPIERNGGAPSAMPMDLLRDGWNLVIFPEGTRSPDGARGRFRLGAAYLAINAGVPVVPVGVRGAFAAMPRGRSWPLPGRPPVSLRFGRPMWAAPGEDVRSFTARLAIEVDRLCAEDATSWWEALRAALFPSGPVGARAGRSAPVADGEGLVAAGGAGRQVPAARRGVEDGVAGVVEAPVDAPVEVPVVAGTGGVSGRVVPGRTSPRALARAPFDGPGGRAAISARLRGAPNTPAARWRRIWAATEPAPRAGSRSPWRR